MRAAERAAEEGGGFLVERQDLPTPPGEPLGTGLASGVTAEEGGPAGPLAPASWSRYRLHHFAPSVGAIAAGLGVIVLAGWLGGFYGIPGIRGGQATMKANTAIAVAALGASLLLQTLPFLPPKLRRLPLALAAAATFLAAATLLEYTARADFGIDEALVRDPFTSPASFPGRISFASSLALTLLGTSLALLQSRRYSPLSDALATGAGITGLMSLTGYFYGAPSLTGIASFSSISLETAALISLLSLAGLFAQPDRPFVRVLLSDHAGGVIARRLLPILLAAVFTGGYLRLQGERAGLFNLELGLGLFTVANTLLIVFTVWVVAHQLNTSGALQLRAERELRASEERYRVVAETASDALLTIDAKSRIVLANPAVESVFGYRHEELEGRSVAVLIPGPLKQQHVDAMERYLETGIRRLDWRARETTGLHKSGRLIPLEISYGESREAGKRHFTAIVRDITERKAAQDELARRAAELSRSNSELEQFAYVASHDLQEPLRMVASYTQLLSRRYKGKLDGEADEFIGYAVDGANRMQALINDLLTFSRVGTRGKPLESVNSAAALESALLNLEVAIEEAKAKVTHGPLPTVVADEGQFTQLFQNLVGNAVKFHGATPPEIHVSAERDGRSWRFSVRDNGIGIDPRHFDRLFIVFQRLHGRTEYPGTGIGLAVCKKIVERHKGRIWVESAAGKGSTFFFTIPDANERGVTEK